MSTSLCRVCLAGNVRMFSIEDDRLLEVYEKLTSSELNTADGMPSTICYICVSQLQRCRRFADLACESANILTRLLHDGIEVTLNNVTALDLDNPHHLAVHHDTQYSINSSQVKVKQEQVVKEEATEDEDLIENEERFGDEDIILIDEDVILVDKRNNQNIEHLENKINVINPYFCDMCKKQCPSKGVMLRLRKIDSGEVINACNRCSKTLHKQQQPAKKLTVEKPYNCTECSRSFKNKDILKIHMQNHTGGKPYICNVCNKEFNQAESFKHMLAHVEKPIICQECGKAFRYATQFNQHMRIHTGEKPFVCHQCGKAFAYNYSLNQHLLTHTGEKPYICNVCNKAFNKSGHLKRHKLIHSREKPLKIK